MGSLEFGFGVEQFGWEITLIKCMAQPQTSELFGFRLK